jgi:hypothetical protein
LAGEQALPFDEDDEEHKEEVEDEEPTYCRDLDKVEIALPRDGDGFEYCLVLNEHPTEDEYKEAQQDAKRTRQDVLTSVATGKNMDSHNKVNSLLMSDTSDRSDTSSPSDSCSVMAKENMRKKCKYMRELKTFTGNSARKRSKKVTKTAIRVGHTKGKHLW